MFSDSLYILLDKDIQFKVFRYNDLWLFINDNCLVGWNVQSRVYFKFN